MVDVDGLSVVSLVNDLRHVVVNELRQVIGTVRAPVGRVLDRRSSRAHEVFQV